MTSREFIERLIEDLKKLIVVVSNTKSLTQVNAETVANARKTTWNADYYKHPDKSLCEFAIALNLEMVIPYSLDTIARLINHFKIIFTSNGKKVQNFNLFLKELETNKADLVNLLSKLESKVFVDLGTGERGNLATDLLKREFDNAHDEISVSNRNYEQLLKIRQGTI